jgi:hypothetical protein
MHQTFGAGFAERPSQLSFRTFKRFCCIMLVGFKMRVSLTLSLILFCQASGFNQVHDRLIKPQQIEGSAVVEKVTIFLGKKLQITLLL